LVHFGVSKSSPNPFRYGDVVSGDLFAGRQEEVRVLVGRIEAGINVTVEGPRRYGKSSLIKEATRMIAASGDDLMVVQANLMMAATPAQLAADLLTAAHRSMSRLQRGAADVGQFLRRFKVSPSVTFADDGRPTFTISPTGDARSPVELRAVMEGCFEVLSSHRSGPAVLVLDEFQQCMDIEPGLPHLLKALADAHGSVSLVLAGSHRHLMTTLTGSVGAPLHKMTEPLPLGPVDRTQMTEFVVTRMTAAGRWVEEGAAEAIVDHAAPAPNDIQRLAWTVFDRSASSGRVEVGLVDTAMSEAAIRTSAQYRDRIESLPLSQHSLLRMAASGPIRAPSSAAVVRQSGLANGTSVLKAIKAMDEKELLVRRDGAWIPADPFLARWIRDSVASGE
jgi:hypothetical protein